MTLDLKYIILRNQKEIITFESIALCESVGKRASSEIGPHLALGPEYIIPQNKKKKNNF